MTRVVDWFCILCAYVALAFFCALLVLVILLVDGPKGLRNPYPEARARGK